jgi:hypothetical protein
MDAPIDSRGLNRRVGTGATVGEGGVSRSWLNIKHPTKREGRGNRSIASERTGQKHRRNNVSGFGTRAVSERTQPVQLEWKWFEAEGGDVDVTSRWSRVSAGCSRASK